MEEYKVIEEIYQAIENNGLMPTIKKFFGAGTRIELPFSEKSCNTEIENLDFSVRSYNCLKRAGLHTVSNVIDAMHEDSLLKIRSLGKNSSAEIYVKIYEFGYYSLTERGKKNFVKSLLELNKDKYTVTNLGETLC